MRPERGRRPVLLVFLLLAALPGAARAADATPQQQIEEHLMCYCGCSDLTVRVCTCGAAAAMRQEIAARLADGESSDAILAAFVDRYGEQILSAPTKEGFNLVAWVMPFAVILITSAVLVVAIRRWSAQSSADREPPDGPAARPGNLSKEQRRALERVEREMREMH